MLTVSFFSSFLSALDVLRLAVRHDVFAKCCCAGTEGDSLMAHLLQCSQEDGPPANIMLVFRTFANLFATEHGSELLLKSREKVCCHAVQYRTLHCIALHCTALHCTALHCTVLHCTALHCTALHCTALHCTTVQYSTAQHSTAQYSAVQHSTAQHSTLHSTVQYSIVQYSTIHYITLH